MAILVDATTKVICQGITGKAGAFHTRNCIAAGTKVIAGVTPGRGGKLFDNTIPIYNTVRDAISHEPADVSVIFVPAPYAADAIEEAADAGIGLIICITEGIPQRDMIVACQAVKSNGAMLIGPNCPGIVTPGQCKIGIMPYHIHTPGRVGVISRSGTLTYEAVAQLTALGTGQSTCIGMGGDPIHGLGFIELLKLFEDDAQTEAIVMIGEIGGNEEEQAAEWIHAHGTKPVVAFIAGASAPEGRRMGHAGAIISGSSGTAAAKIDALEKAGVTVCRDPARIGSGIVDLLGKGARS